MKSLDPKQRITGLKLNVRLGDGLSINQGTLKVQVVEINGNYVKLAIKSDPDAFHVDRAKRDALLVEAQGEETHGA